MNVSISKAGSKYHPEAHGDYSEEDGTLEITHNERLGFDLPKGTQLFLRHGGRDMTVEVVKATADPTVFNVKPV